MASHERAVCGPWGRSFAKYSTKYTKIFRSSLLASLKQSNQYCKLIESVPSDPDSPDRRCATSITVSSVKSTGTSSGGRQGYASRLLDKGDWYSVFFNQSMSITDFPVFEHALPSSNILPFSLSMIHCTKVQSFLWSTRLWNVFTW